MAQKQLQLAFDWETDEVVVPEEKEGRVSSPPDDIAFDDIAFDDVANGLKVHPTNVTPSRAQVVRTLQQQISRVESSKASDPTAHSTGVGILDRLLPGGGLTRGVIVEWLAMKPGGAASHLSLAVAAQTLKVDDRGGVLLVIDREGTFYPPAAVALGIPPEKMFLVRPTGDADALWAIDQGLRCPAVTVVWGEVAKLNSLTARRLQLAAEQHNGLFFSVRPAAAIDQPSWAEVRWQVQPLASPDKNGRRVKVDLVRCRGGRAGSSVILEIEDQTGTLRELPQPSLKAPTDITAAINLANELARIKTRKQELQRETG